MADINLLPQDKKAKDTKPPVKPAPVQYTDPKKEVTLAVKKKTVPAPQRPSAPVRWWRKLLRKQKNRKAAEQADQQRPTEAQPSAAVAKPAEPQPAAVTSKPVQTPSAPAPKPTAKQRQHHSLLPHSYHQGKQRQTAKATKQSQPAAEKPAAEQKLTMPPMRKNGRSFIAVDLVSDRSQFFSMRMFYRRLIISLLIMAGVAVVGVATYFVVASSRQAGGEAETVRQQIETVQRELRQLDQRRDELVTFEAQLRQIVELLDGHPFWSRIFALLEQSTLPGVQFTSLSVDSQYQVLVSGRATDYLLLAQQIAVWEAATATIVDVDFSSANLTDDNEQPYVGFSAVLTINTEFVSGQ